MRKIMLVASIAAAALAVSACSQGTEDAAEATVDGAVDDTAANVDAAGAAVEGAVDDAGAAVYEGADAVAVGAAAAEGEIQEETPAAAAAD